MDHVESGEATGGVFVDHVERSEANACVRTESTPEENSSISVDMRVPFRLTVFGCIHGDTTDAMHINTNLELLYDTSRNQRRALNSFVAMVGGRQRHDHGNETVRRHHGTHGDVSEATASDVSASANPRHNAGDKLSACAVNPTGNMIVVSDGSGHSTGHTAVVVDDGNRQREDNPRWWDRVPYRLPNGNLALDLHRFRLRAMELPHGR